MCVSRHLERNWTWWCWIFLTHFFLFSFINHFPLPTLIFPSTHLTRPALSPSHELTLYHLPYHHHHPCLSYLPLVPLTPYRFVSNPLPTSLTITMILCSSDDSFNLHLHFTSLSLSACLHFTWPHLSCCLPHLTCHQPSSFTRIVCSRWKRRHKDEDWRVREMSQGGSEEGVVRWRDGRRGREEGTVKRE